MAYKVEQYTWGGALYRLHDDSQLQLMIKLVCDENEINIAQKRNLKAILLRKGNIF